MKSTMRIRHVGETLIAVHGAQDPTDSEWQEWLDQLALGAKTKTMRRTLITSAGGGPNSAQRKRIGDVPGIAPIPTAVITANRIGRGIVTAVGWFGKNIKAFAPADLDDALDYLTVPAQQRPVLVQAIDEMKVELGID